MAWASTDIVPASVFLNAKYSLGGNAFLDTITFKIIPRSSTGAIFDFTAATASLAFAAGNMSIPYALSLVSNSAPTIVAHDATGLTLTLSLNNLAVLCDNQNVLNLALSITATDGTTNLLVATGSLVVQPVA